MRIILHGFRGKMGRVIRQLAESGDRYEIVAGIDAREEGDGAPFPIYADIKACDMPADVIVDFSTAAAVPGVLDYAVEKGVPAVICTTGLTPETNEKLALASQKVAVFQSANMSLGINLLANILKRYAKVLDDANFDVEIIEKHHNQKIDAPSGTALFLGAAVNESIGQQYDYVNGRSGVGEKRTTHEIGFHAVRGGSIVGEHSAIFAGKDEVLEFQHTAYSKEIFAVGALKAAQYMAGKAPGRYDMQNIMNEL